MIRVSNILLVVHVHSLDVTSLTAELSGSLTETSCKSSILLLLINNADKLTQTIPWTQAYKATLGISTSLAKGEVAFRYRTTQPKPINPHSTNTFWEFFHLQIHCVVIIYDLIFLAFKKKLFHELEFKKTLIYYLLYAKHCFSGFLNIISFNSLTVQT